MTSCGISIKWAEPILKGIAAVAIAASPALLQNSLPEVNPGIIEKLWWVTIAAAGVFALVFFAFSRWLSTSICMIIATLLLAMAIVCLVGIYSIVEDVISVKPNASAFGIRMLLIGLFASLSGCVSIAVALILDWLLPARPKSFCDMRTAADASPPK